VSDLPPFRNDVLLFSVNEYDKRPWRDYLTASLAKRESQRDLVRLMKAGEYE